MAISISKQKALSIKEACEKYGWNYNVRGTVLTISKTIKPNDNEDFSKADSEYGSILELLPQSSAGSSWGDSGDGIGALSAIKHGRFVMNKSGGNKNVLKALAKL